MKKPCDCTHRHEPIFVVLTGGPGSGKTAVLELIRLFFCRHVVRLPESAGIVFGGGFPRDREINVRQAGQRAIFHVQRELEQLAGTRDVAVALCDRGTVDGAAYWVGDGTLFTDVGTTLERELRRYHAVIHLRTPADGQGYGHDNPLRIESASEAAAIDARLVEAWAAHPRRYEIAASEDFLTKAAHALAVLRDLVPPCCRHHVADFLWDGTLAPQRRQD